MAHSSKSAVGAAIVGNGLVMMAKFAAFIFTGSAAMLSEALHSLADTLNQILLMVGIVRSSKQADRLFPFGYGAERQVWALMSAVGIFFLGSGVTIYHGIQSMLSPHHLESLGWAVAVLLVSLVIEGYVLWVAVRTLVKAAEGRPLLQYALRDADPTAVAVVLEDAAACLGILLALSGILLSRYTGIPIWDAVASVLIGILLGGVAIWLIARNRHLLVGPAVPPEVRASIESILEKNPVVEKVVRLRTRVLDTQTYRVAADVEFAGEELAKKLEPQLQSAYPEIKSYQDFRAFAATFADAVVEQLGDEIDDMEASIKTHEPRARYLDIETD